MTAALIRKIHVGCRQLGLDEDLRRDLQREATGKDSLRGMSEAELKAVLKVLKNRGFKPVAKGRHAPAPRADLRLVHKLWWLLDRAGAVKANGRAGLNAFIRARFAAHWGSVPADIDMLRNHAQIADVIDALKAMCRRAGIELDQ